MGVTINKKARISALWSILLAFCTVLSFTLIPKVFTYEEAWELSYQSSSWLFEFIAFLRYRIAGESLVYIIAFVFLVKTYHKFFNRENRKFVMSSAILSLLFVFFYLTGVSFSQYGDASYLLGKPYQPFFFIIQVIGFYTLFYIVISWGFTFLLKKQEYLPRLSKSSAISWVQKHYFIVMFLFILICWLPFLLILYPGSVPTDSVAQLSQALGYREMSANNPVFITWLMGAFFSIGRRILNDNFGVFLYILFQSAISALIFAAICKRILTMKLHPAFSIASVLFYALVPVWWASMQCMLKDVIHASFFAWFMMEYTNAALANKLSKKDFILFFISIILATFTRKTAFVIVFLSVFVLIIIKKKTYVKEFAAVLLSFGAVYLVVNSFVFPALGVHPGSNRDTFSLPFQQTALYAQWYGDELSEEEIKIINDVLDLDTITEKYNPAIADPVKETYHGTNETLEKYLGLWARQFWKHPDAYIQATIANAYGYFYPNFISQYSFRNYISPSNYFEISYINPPSYHVALQNCFHLWTKLPVLNFLMSPGTYTWILLLLLTFLLFNKKAAEAAILFPLMALLIGCIFSPVNGEIRYVLPIIASIPLMIACTVALVQKKRETVEDYDSNTKTEQKGERRDN